MTAKVVRYNVIQDYTDRTAADVMAANPGMFSSTSDVPVFLYQSLKTLWLGASAASSEFAAKVSPYLGGGDADPRGSIQIVQVSTVQSVLSEDDILKSNEIGAETADIIFNLTTPRTATTSDFLDNAVQRLKYILDHELRGYRGLSPCLTVQGDNTVVSDCNYLCRFIDYGTELRVSNVQVLFRVCYTRVFAR